MKPKRPWREAALWMLACGAFFFASYGMANWAATSRVAVPEVRFGWERWIPFLPWTILPYWSTDPFFAISFFLCASRHELHVHVKRILAAQITCVVVFLAFPLRFGEAVPDAVGAFHPLFVALHGFDRPFNQAPSLHVALAAILWSCYSEHTRGAMRVIVRAWLSLTVLSTLTTYQHHFLDLPTGLWVGLFCTVLFPMEKIEETRHQRGMLVGAIYGAGASGFCWLAVHFGGAAWILLWPTGALLIVALSYFTGTLRWIDPSHDKVIALLLAPYLLGVRINTWLWGHREPAAHEIEDGIWVGRARSGAKLEHIHSIVHLAPEVRVTRRNIPRRLVPMLDFVVPSHADLDAAVQAIEDLKDIRPTLVCCALGYTRSVAATAAWMMATQSVPLDSAIGRIQGRRRIALTAGHREQLQAWANARRNHGA